MNKFTSTYNKYKNMYQINEGNIKQLIPMLQDTILKKQYDNRTYNQLSDTEKQKVNKTINFLTELYTEVVEDITPNKQHRSWIYDIIKNQNMSYDQLQEIKYPISTHLKTFEQLVKSSRFEQSKNILDYKTYSEFIQTVEDNKDLLIKKEQAPFEYVLGDSTYDVYAVYLKDEDVFQRVYGTEGYDCGWCTVNPEKDMFKRYLEEENDCYYLITYKGTNKPFALLHYRTDQFMDIHNNKMNQTPELLNLLAELYKKKS